MLEPFEEQKDFVAENVQSLAEAYATRNEGNNALPLAVYNDDDLIGFVMIGKGTVGNEDESDLIKENYCIWRLMIDKKYQGRGLESRRLMLPCL
jgi:diamine N-acetyltransferase